MSIRILVWPKLFEGNHWAEIYFIVKSYTLNTFYGRGIVGNVSWKKKKKQGNIK